MRKRERIKAVLSAAACLILGFQSVCAALTYGQPLKQSVLPETAVDGVQGVWSWLEPEKEPDAGTAEYQAVFTPHDTSNYNPVTALIPVTTKPAVPVVTDARAAAESGTRLSSVTGIAYTAVGVRKEPVNGRFASAEPAGRVSRSGKYPFTFYPESLNYSPVTVQVSITVTGNTAAGGGHGRPAGVKFTVIYETGGLGTIVAGSRTETVQEGQYPEKQPVVKTGTDTVFLGWSLDGETLVQPESVRIYEDTIFTAVYQPANGNQQHTAYLYGYEDGTFRPESSITRAETAAIFARITTTHAERRTTVPKFSDLMPGQWYIPDVSKALSAGIMQGYDDSTFRPDAPVTRAEFAVVAAQYLELPAGLQSGYPDCAGHWADGYISALAGHGIISGYEDGTFRPDNPITRAEAVKIVNGLTGRSTVCTFSRFSPFTDLSPQHWAYEQILEASQAHACQSVQAILLQSPAE